MEHYPAVSASLRGLRRDVQALAVSAGAQARGAQIAQAASEAAANAIVHGHDGGDAGGFIELTVAHQLAGVTVTIGDRGSGFRPSRITPGLGLGLALIAQLADELELRERTGGGVEVWMRFDRSL